jgi:hypothetical protein
MLTFTALGQDFSLVEREPTTMMDRLKQVASRVTSRAEVATASTGGCLPGDAMSEFGCITPKVPGPNYSAMNSYYVCPPYSTEYDQMWCLRQAVPKGFEHQPLDQKAAMQVFEQQPLDQKAAFEQQPEQQPDQTVEHEQDQTVEHEQGVMTMYVCADGTRVGDPSLCPIVAAPDDGTGPSPGMQVQPAPPAPEDEIHVPQWSVQDERKRWMKWATIGAVVIGAGVVAAVLRR